MEKECLNCTSLKSSLAEKEVTINDLRGRWLALKDSNAEYQSRLFSDALKVQKELRAQLASLKKENERLKSDSSSGLSVKYKLELLKQIWKLQLENGVMRSALERINEYCNDPSCGSVSKHALSTATKSSLMEKVRAFIQIFDGQTEPLHPISWMAALTEVKKEMGDGG